jgi:hypothetical protein
MPVAALPQSTIRLERADSSRLLRGFIVSLALHLLIGGTWYGGNKFGWWQNWHWPAWMQAPPMLTDIFKKKDKAQPTELAQQEPPLMFVNVTPAQETPEPPKNAQYYSSKNSQAANPEASKETNTPKIDGKQTEMVRTEDTTRQKFLPLQPSRPVEQAKVEQSEMKPKWVPDPGDLTLSKPNLQPQKETGQETRSRPRTIQEAMARKQMTPMPGEKIKQEGGVKRHLDITSLDAKATPFGAYDAMLVDQIAQSWYGLLDDRGYTSDDRGKVILQFTLHSDGRVTDLAIFQNTVTEVLALICQQAINRVEPFEKWPDEMHRLMGDTRHIQFTFYYN